MTLSTGALRGGKKWVGCEVTTICPLGDGDSTLVEQMIQDNPELRFGRQLEEATGKFSISPLR
jgi:hypothetical protein